MHIKAIAMRSSWIIVFVLILIWGSAQAQQQTPRSQTEDSTSGGCRIVSLRSSQSAGKVRLVVETSQKPDYQVYQQNEHLIVELFDTAPCQVQPEKIRDHSFLRHWEISNPALGLFRWDITGRYPVPAEQCRIEVLNNPHRLAVDIYTKWTEDEHYQLTPGVSWHRRQYFGQICPYLLWNQVSFDPRDEHVTLDIASGQDRPGKCEAVSSIVSRKNALAGINGGYFNMAGGEPLGLIVREGQIINPHVTRRPPRTAFGLTKDKKGVFARAKAVNGQVLTLDNRVWPDIELALGGGPRLLSGGTMQLTTDEEALGPKGNDITRSCGRTAVSTDSQGRIAFSTASGYSDNHSEGIKLDQMAHLLLRSGAVDAVNLDGGGSVNMAIRGNLVAHGPGAGKYERPVANALVLYDDRPSTAPAQIDLQFEPAKIQADGSSSCKVGALVRDAQGNNVQDGTSVFFHAPGIKATRAFTVSGQAYAECTALRLSTPIPISVTSGFAKAQAFIGLKYSDPDRMLVRWYRTVKDSDFPLRSDEDSSLRGPARTSPTPMLAPGSETKETAEDVPESEQNSDPGESQEQNDGRRQEPPSAADALQPAPIAAEARRLQIIDIRVRIIDKWYNGLSFQTVEIMNDGKMLGSYTTDQYGEIKASVQIPGETAKLEIRSAGLQPYKVYFSESLQ